MSFLGGPECSTAGNPLSQFTKHVQDDKSLQRDKLAGQAQSGFTEGFRSQPNLGNQDHLMQEFLQQNGSIPRENQSAFSMGQLRRDLDGYRINAPLTADPSWAGEFDATQQNRMDAVFQNPQMNQSQPSTIQQSHPAVNGLSESRGSAIHQSPFNIGYQRPAGMGYGTGYQRGMGYGGGYQTGMGMDMMAGPFRANGMQRRSSSERLSTDKGKGRMVELDDKNWEKQFDAIQSASKDAVGDAQRDMDTEANEAIDEELDQVDRSVHTETNEHGDFESIWRGIAAETRANGLDRYLNGDHDTRDMHMGEEIPLSSLNTWDGFDSHFQDAFRDPQLGNYLFEPDNPFSATRNPFDEGMKVMREGGNLSLAALAFEAAVQQDPEHVEAWYNLGTAQAQNEKEAPAIRALEQALKLNPAHLPALMGLAISYTNEGYDSTAYRTLERWLATKYPQIISPDDVTPENEFGFTDRHLLHEKVTDLFIKAAQLSPNGEHMDPDVQVGLGVLFYGAEDYSKAVDCFEAALASTEEGITNEPGQAHLLWNRLGATLANSGRSEDAIGAYEKALTLRPNFVRARYNLGVSCINIGVYEQAVQHLLGALSMHNVVEREGIEKVKEVMGMGGDGGERMDNTPEVQSVEEVERMMSMNQSTNLIETLRRVFGSMGRRDLAERVERGMDVEAFRSEFDF